MSEGYGIRARAKVERVIDGDTMVVMMQWPVTIRLKDCWAREIRGPDKEEGLKAKDHLMLLAPKGSSVSIDIDTSDADKLGDIMSFGRVVGNVSAVGKDETLSQWMVKDCFASSTKNGEAGE